MSGGSNSHVTWTVAPDDPPLHPPRRIPREPPSTHRPSSSGVVALTSLVTKRSSIRVGCGPLRSSTLVAPQKPAALLPAGYFCLRCYCREYNAWECFSCSCESVSIQVCKIMPRKANHCGKNQHGVFPAKNPHGDENCHVHTS
ncbi:hypothetical protein SETIT_5G010900v2 [Setaria italica]|uniref:Uncharacterized protein n=1 Tax=Setaria italica TaxID=4555 RepID=A0A368QZX3_SETIT|nr:hypothetical protein SETIT_5G010900v2 [Setaria italica]